MISLSVGDECDYDRLRIFLSVLSFRIAFLTVGDNCLASPHDRDFVLDNLEFNVDEGMV